MRSAPTADVIDRHLLLTLRVPLPQVCLDSGLPAPDSGASAPTMSARAAPGSVCLICQEVLEAGKAAVSSLACGHAFCNGCWATYLELKIAEGDIAISCPQYKCRLRVPEEVVASLCPGEVALRFKAFLRNSFVDDSRTATWCPHAGCTLAVDTAAAGEGGFVTCGSGHALCTRCKHPDAHAPAPCALVKQWQIKCDDDSETMNWLHTHTQDCPQCKMTIEKNGGCNHMTCRSCQHQFCWVCAGPWTAHGDSYYSCSKFNADTKATKESSQASSRAALERYLVRCTCACRGAPCCLSDPRPRRFPAAAPLPPLHEPRRQPQAGSSHPGPGGGHHHGAAGGQPGGGPVGGC